MSVPSTDLKHKYEGTGTQTEWPFTFKVFDKTQLLVKKIVGSVETELVLDVDYTVAGAGSDTGGGTVTYPIVGTALAVGEYIVIKPNFEFSQDLVLRNQNTFPPKPGEYINAGWYVEAGESIKAGGYIEAGGSSGIVAGLSITCKGTLSFGLKAFAGICSWREISEEEKTITCEKFNGGVVEYGILKETGLEEDRKIELSMDEIAQKFGVAVKDLKIKKD